MLRQLIEDQCEVKEATHELYCHTAELGTKIIITTG